jgi:hypothetical protein
MANIRTASFVYRSPLAQSDEHYVVTVTVKELLYSDGKTYMDIHYDFDAKMKDTRQHIVTHPFYDSEVSDFLTYDGEIIARNPMTAMMVEYLLMEDAELAKFTGNTTPQDYKHKIMLSLAYFWD